MKYFTVISNIITASAVLLSCTSRNDKNLLPLLLLAQSPKQWTIMLYLDGDDVDMQTDYLDTFEDIVNMKVGSTNDVNIVVQFDRCWHPDPRFGGWEIAHRFYLTPGMAPLEENAIHDWGDGRGGREVDMSDPDTLSDFISWGARHYPAQHYALLAADHGFGWKGLIQDATSFNNHMTLREFKEAIDVAKVRIDLLALNACLMQMAEVAYELHDSPIVFMVGSEMPGTAWPMAAMLQDITDRPLMSAVEMGRMMCDLYVDTNAPHQQVTLSTMDLSCVNELAEKVNDLVQALLVSGKDESHYADAKIKAGEVMAALENAVVYSKSNNPDANGLSIYFPENPTDPYTELYYFYQPGITRFSAECGWRNFLDVYYNIMMYPQFPIDPRIFTIRNSMNILDSADPNIDLYDFCRRIVDSV